MATLHVEHYLTPDERRNPYLDWLSAMRDTKARIAIIRRIIRLQNGNYGDHAFCREGVWELRVDTGPGYRIYYAQRGQRVVVLLGGGDKRSQSSDITRAVRYWQDWQRRHEA